MQNMEHGPERGRVRRWVVGRGWWAVVEAAGGSGRAADGWWEGNVTADDFIINHPRSRHVIVAIYFVYPSLLVTCLCGSRVRKGCVRILASWNPSAARRTIVAVLGLSLLHLPSPRLPLPLPLRHALALTTAY